MALLDTNSDELIAAAEQAPTPIQRKEPTQRFSAWKMLGAAPKGVAAGAAEATGSTADILGAFGQALATTGGSGKGMFATPTPEERKQTNEATDKLLKEGIDYNSEAGRLFRNVSADYTPDAQTAHVAESAVFNLFRVGSKALTSAATMGNIPGAVVAGLEEGFTQSDQLGQQGVDLATRSKVGAVTALTNALGFALPVAGATWKSTAALAVAGGPASFIAQNAATREILQAADYSKLADQYDPLDPVGLALSTLLPLGFGAFAMRRAKVKPGVEDKGPMPDGTSPDIKAPAPADTAQPATKGIANVQDAQAPAGTKAQATPDQAGTNAAGNATPPTDVPGTGAADVQANGVAPKQGPGAPLANGFFAGPVEGEKFRVSDVSATGGLTLDKRLKAGTASTMYVGVDGGFIDANNVNLIGDGASKIWKPITDAARNAAREILQEMGTLPLGNKRREELKAKLKEVVANDGTPPPDTVPPKMSPPDDLVDAARVNLVREHMDATNPKPGDLEASTAHSEAYTKAMEQQAEGRPVNIMDVAPKIEPIAGKATDTPNFKAWFGESKVVDDTGAPMVVYHGTVANIPEFGGSEWAGWFSKSPEQAATYAETGYPIGMQGPNTIPAFVSIKNPLRIDLDMNADIDTIKPLLRELGMSDALYEYGRGAEVFRVVTSEKFAAEVKRLGYDGIAVKEGGVETYAPASPNQIKSAIGNSGKFDPNSASLTDNPIADWGAGLTKALDDMAAERAKLQPKPAPALADTAQAATKTIAKDGSAPAAPDAAPAKPADTGQPVSAGEASLDARLADISYRNPTALDAEIAVAFDENGKPTSTMTAREYLDMVKQEAASDVKDASVPARDGQAATDPAASTSGFNPAALAADAARFLDGGKPVAQVIGELEASGTKVTPELQNMLIAASEFGGRINDLVDQVNALKAQRGANAQPFDLIAQAVENMRTGTTVEAPKPANALAARLEDISYRNPQALDAPIRLEADDNGNQATAMTARDYLEMIKKEAAQDSADADLLEVAANCFLNGGA